ncbi:MAG: hypothetical protein A2X22_03700 [Bacteroidetes bacterium GWF2_49_14]|nr:MAG: hypothetical protein A2X22_03700 [Bacteroidetes bacterium GWF2_49_14]
MKSPCTGFLLAISFFLLHSCTNPKIKLQNESQVPELNINLAKDPPFDFEIVKFIPVSNKRPVSDLSFKKPDTVFFLSRIVYAQIFVDRIYLKDDKDGSLGIAYLFDLKGGLIWKSRKGKGPGEIVAANNLYADPFSGDLVINDGGVRIHRFSKDGRFINKKESPFGINFMNSLSPDIEVFVSSAYTGKPYKVFQINGGEIIPYPIQHLITKGTPEFGETNNFQYFNEHLLFTYYLTDTVYSLTATELRPFLRLNFIPSGIGSLSRKQIAGTTRVSELFREQKISHKSDWFCFHEDFFYCHASNNQYRYICKVNYKTNQSWVQRLDKVNVFGISYPQLHFVGYAPDGLIFSLDADRLGTAAREGLLDLASLESGILSRLKKLSNLDNPVLVIVK